MRLRLMREIRFSVAGSGDASARNSWAGWPASDALVPYLTLQAIVSGDLELVSGYVCSTKDIDRVLRGYAVGYFLDVVSCDRGSTHAADAMIPLWGIIASNVPSTIRLEQLTLRVTPHLSFSVERSSSTMVSVSYDFEFSAAHRLYCDALNEEENERLFGRCANPKGHGHNYVVRVTVRGRPDEATGTIIALDEFTRIVNERIIERFDHKHLNEDCVEFAEVNPSVENITRVIFEKLKGAFGPAELARVRVYETPKTYAEFGGV
jgi:6-pyruvoyltetrahydropterin/6-carboxytetrahydropterin synthase